MAQAKARSGPWLTVAVAASGAAALGAGSFAWSLRLRTPLPAFPLGAIAVFVVPAVVPALVGRRADAWSPRALVAPVVASILGYFAALALCVVLWSAGFGV